MTKPTAVQQPGTHLACAVCCVVTCRMHSLEQSFTEARVPGGLQYMSVVTHLSTVQIVFMNRFLVEFLDYLAGKACCCCEN